METLWKKKLEQLEKHHHLRSCKTYAYIDASHVRMDDKSYLMMASNDYLGLAHDRRVLEAAKEALVQYGLGSTGSRLTSGTNPVVTTFERELAEFKGSEKALVYNTGYMANVGVITGLMKSNDVIIGDELNHASIIDGCRLSGATLVTYRHKDMMDLEAKLKEHEGKQILIVTDSVFSMDGDIAPLPDIVELAQKYGALTMVDDAHATGVLGDGRGSSHYFNVPIDIQIGTMSKALGSEGGFVAGSKVLIDYLINKSRSFIYSTALSPVTVAGALASLRIIRDDSSVVSQLHSNVEAMKMYLQQVGVTVATETPIFPIIVGDAATALAMSEALHDKGIILTAIRPPTVPRGGSRLRLTVTAAHNKQDLEMVAREIAANI